MQANEFRSIIKTFTDPDEDIVIEKHTITMSVDEEIIEIQIKNDNGDVFVQEKKDDDFKPAAHWIIERLANIPLLAKKISSGVPPTKYFVSPSALLEPTLEKGHEKKQHEDAKEIILKTLEDRSELETNIIYITSDAGEGKTSIINQLAYEQAERFKKEESQWLLVPIPLGGRPFLRFDDITIGVLRNHYRFKELHYTSFLALIKMGIIIPAFDGFEEMFVENSSGEALSAMGVLVASLVSQGAVVIAARKAYFEFSNLRMQEHLFDTIRKYDVNFTKIELKRWSEPQFLEYGKNRGIKNISELYKKVCERLTPNHALLTRAVLVKRLLDMAENSSLDDLLERLDKSGTDFFSVFVKSIIEREANEKWIDRSGQNEVGTPLLTIEEHCRLLSLISLNMWESRIEYLKSDTFELVIEIFSDEVRKKPHQIKQIQERIKGHALLVVSPSVLDAIQFDHDEFRLFFLGEAIAQQISSQTEQTKKDIWNIFRRGILPLPAQQSFIRSLSRNHQLVYSQIIHLLLDVAAMDIQTSYTHQNCTDVISHLISNRNSSDELKITKMIFNNDALRDKKISNIVFDNCYFLPSSLEITTLNKCSFINCRFDELRIFKSTKIENIVFKDSKVECLQLYEKDSIWNPMEIQMHLKNLGISMPESDNQESISEQQNEPDPNLYNMEKLLRYFMRSTHIGEHVIVMKLGGQGQAFINDAIPQLLKYGVMEEIENRGGDNQRRFRLGVSLHTIRNAIFCAKGSFNVFLQHIETKEISSS